MSTTRPFSPGDRGREPSGASGVSEGDVPATGGSDEGAARGAKGESVEALRFSGHRLRGRKRQYP